MERKINAREFTNSILESWSDYLRGQARERAEQAGQYIGEGNFDLFDQGLQDAKGIAEQARGIARIWSSIADLLEKEGIGEVPGEVVSSLIERWSRPVIQEETVSYVTPAPQEPVAPDLLVSRRPTRVKVGDIQILGEKVPGLTKREAELLQFIESRQAEGVYPVTQEIASALGITLHHAANLLSQVRIEKLGDSKLQIVNTESSKGKGGRYVIEIKSSEGIDSGLEENPTVTEHIPDNIVQEDTSRIIDTGIRARKLTPEEIQTLRLRRLGS